jgi:histidine triad (HIT) family protein
MSGGGSESGDCVFCNIASRRVPAHIIFEDASTAAFLDLYPYTRGHLLVVPKRHAARLPELPPDDQTALMRTVGEVCRRIERLCPDYHVSLNAGAKAGQVVFHVHFHVIPRYSEENPFLGSGRVRLREDDARELVRELSRA